MENMAFPKVSFIIIHTNDKQVLEAEKWIDCQDYLGEVEKIILDNKGNKGFSSASAALNYGAEKSSGEILFFIHQDLYLWDTSTVRKCVDFIIKKGEKNIVLGCAGVAKNDQMVHFDIFIGDTKERYAWEVGDNPLLAITLDECMLVMKKSVWRKLKFDEKTCADWHFYGADICYGNTLSGGENYIISLKNCHDSFGTPSGKGFYCSAKKMVVKYSGRIDRIQTTCMDTSCSILGVNRFHFAYTVKSFIKGCFSFFRLEKLFKKINAIRKRKKGLFVQDKSE